MTVLQSNISNPNQALLDRIAELEAKLAANKRVASLTLKVSEKGAVSCYGLGKWPVTLYKSQWERLLGAKEDIQAFMAANAARLTTKD